MISFYNFYKSLGGEHNRGGCTFLLSEQKNCVLPEVQKGGDDLGDHMQSYGDPGVLSFLSEDLLTFCLQELQRETGTRVQVQIREACS